MSADSSGGAGGGNGPVLAVDIGGTKLAAAIVSPSGEVLRRREIATPASAEGEAVLTAALAGLVAEVATGGDGTPPRAAAVAAAGPVDPPSGTISPVNIPAWRDFDVVSCVGRAAGGVPTSLLGDAVAAAVGEHWLGAGRGSASMLGIVVSTGVGGGLVLDGAAFLGASGNAGHFGHITAEPGGPRCGCGARGCVEAVASGPATLAWAQANGWPGADMPALARDAAAGSPIALAAFDRAADALAVGVVGATALCDLDVVVVGGGVSAAGEVLLAPLRAKTAERTGLAFAKQVRIVQAGLGRMSGLVGAARFAVRSLGGAE